jgi:hypothetical protein
VPACDGVQVTAHSDGRLHSGATTCDAISDIPRRHPLVRHGRTCAIEDQSRQIVEDRSNDWIAWRREDGSTALMLDRERVNRARLPRPMFLPTPPRYLSPLRQIRFIVASPTSRRLILLISSERSASAVVIAAIVCRKVLAFDPSDTIPPSTKAIDPMAAT